MLESHSEFLASRSHPVILVLRCLSDFLLLRHLSEFMFGGEFNFVRQDLPQLSYFLRRYRPKLLLNKIDSTRPGPPQLSYSLCNCRPKLFDY